MTDPLAPEHLLTPSKITAWLDCAHYLTLRSQVEDGTLAQPNSIFGEFVQLLFDKGLQHERQCLAEYRANGKSVLEVPERHKGETFKAWMARVGNPFDDGWDVIYQMPFIHDGMRGVADFVERTPDGCYEPVDAKLARAEAKPGHVLQLCFYADAIEALAGLRPKHMHLWLGSGKREPPLRVDDFAPYWRRLRAQLAKVLAAGPTGDTVPRPCAHCDFCEFRPVCDKQWREDGVLDLVAGIRRPETVVLEDAGIAAMAQLAAQQTPVAGMRPLRLGRLAGQAELQVSAPPDGPPPYRLIAPGEDPTWGRGFEQLPRPDGGDVFLDFEGHPFWRAEVGLFFLFGLLERDDNAQWRYRKWWAHDQDAEATAVSRLVDYLARRRERFPDMHVYHYNHTERSSLVALTETYGVVENELAGLIETGLFVDLLPAARNAIQVGTESYGLKALERLTDFHRSHDIDKGAGAVLQYEQFMKHGDQADLDRIAAYNEDDVRATMALRDWLVDRRPAELAWRGARLDPPEGRPEFDELITKLHEAEPGSAEHLLGDLLGYWLREWLVVREQKRAELLDDSAGFLDEPGILDELQFESDIAPQGRQTHPAKRFRFPSQALDGFRKGGTVIFLAGEEQLCYPRIRRLDENDGVLDLVWDEKLQQTDALPYRAIAHETVTTEPKRKALSAFAARLIGGGELNPVTMALLRRDLPRFTADGGPAGGVFSDDLADMTRWVLNLDRSYAAIQGPPGAGKTYSAAHLIHALVLAGRRVGITATTHHAIDNVLKEVQEVFDDEGDTEQLRAVRKPKTGSKDRLPGVEDGDNKVCARPGFNVVAGTAWLFCSEAMQDYPVDVLLIDEAGQLSLADALAASCAARNLVLLGDPLQLAQVAQASHPNNSGRSVLEHVLDREVTMPAERGVFLSKTFRMHPDVCRFISDEIYQGRLDSDTSCSQQRTIAGTGLRWLRADHRANSTSSPEEAELIAAEIGRLIGTLWTNQKGEEKPLTADDFMVVAPYNDQVRQIRGRLERDPVTDGVPVGTVDKFQGRQAAVVFFSMTTSSGDDMPRGADFLFSRNRLNVAISRARCLAYLVCTEELLNARARTVEDMRLVATLNAVVEYTQKQVD